VSTRGRPTRDQLAVLQRDERSVQRVTGLDRAGDKIEIAAVERRPAHPVDVIGHGSDVLS
jgi:hypothetical protein